MSRQMPSLGPNRKRSEMISRFGVYFLGVALGCLILGMIYMAKNSGLQPVPTQPAPPDSSVPGPR